MYELVINGRTVFTASSKDDRRMAELFDFYRSRKQLFNIWHIAVLNGDEHFYFEG